MPSETVRHWKYRKGPARTVTLASLARLPALTPGHLRSAPTRLGRQDGRLKAPSQAIERTEKQGPTFQMTCGHQDDPQLGLQV